MTPDVHLLSVFADGPGGGNPAPVVADAAGLSDDAMRAVARFYGHESGFVLPAPAGSGCDFAFRFWVPNHEMEMCGHATVGAVWLLDQLGRLPRDAVAIHTASGRVDARVEGLRGSERRVVISQPRGEVETLSAQARAAILDVLGIGAASLAPFPVQNARTSRVKTLVPLRSPAALDALAPDFARVGPLCEAIGSTGLYPYAAGLGAGVFEARQFPKSSGYPEDAATGIAAAALAFGLLATGQVRAEAGLVTVRQGRAMGRASAIAVRFDLDHAHAVRGCWLGGAAHRIRTDPGDLAQS